jgi:outer membrane protein OmpA-like peptidoglycan-associated protein
VNSKSRDWMWMVSGFSLMLLVGCSTDSTTSSMKTKNPTISMNPTDQKIAYAPESEDKMKLKPKDKDTKIKEVKVTKKTDEPKVDVIDAGKTLASLSGSFVDSEHLKPVYFDLHRSKLSEEGMTIVQENAVWIKTQPPFLLEVVGVADQRGSTARNKVIAEHRGASLKQAYIALGIDASRIKVVAMGEETERCAELTEDCFKLSRRAETKIEEKALLAKR